MKDIYFTVTGTSFRHGTDFAQRGDRITLVKEPDNEYDSEAIRAEVPGLGLIGYVANSVRTRIGESMSAGRIYDRIGDRAEGSVCYIMPEGLLCRLDAQPNE